MAYQGRPWGTVSCTKDREALPAKPFRKHPNTNSPAPLGLLNVTCGLGGSDSLRQSFRIFPVGILEGQSASQIEIEVKHWSRAQVASFYAFWHLCRTSGMSSMQRGRIRCRHCGNAICFMCWGLEALLVGNNNSVCVNDDARDPFYTKIFVCILVCLKWVKLTRFYGARQADER